jgi:lipoic acid synthetase
LTIEILTPDFNLDKAVIRSVVEASPDIFAHNIETVPRLYREAREGADYKRSLEVLSYVKECDGAMRTKSGIMLGLGEHEDEASSVIRDIAGTGCDFLSIGQYLAPSTGHFPVKEYITPERFSRYKEEALAAGFRHVLSGTYVRSSYSASEYMTAKRE